MKFHPLANLFPLVEGSAFDDLVADIRAHGLREPVWVYEGQILDGRNRWRACEKAGIRASTREYAGDDPLRFVLSLNLHRRHLTDAQKAVLALDLLPHLEAQARERQGTRTDLNIPARMPESSSARRGDARDQAAAAVGVSARYVSDAKKIAAEAPELAAQMRAGNMTVPAAMRQLADDRRRAELHKPVAVEMPAGLHVGDFRELSANIADECAELVFIDPPYDRDSLGLYADAARVAARILKPGGSLIAYCGQYVLPDVIAGMSQHLRFWWINACVHGGAHARMREYGIVVNWKPMVWFVKGSRGDKQTFVDDLVSGGREKSHHAWQQSEAEAAYYIEKLTSPRGLVVDFFGGGGTTFVAADRIGRPWIGYEINPASAARIAERMKGMAA